MKVYFTVKTNCSYTVCKKTTCESTLPWIHIVMGGIMLLSVLLSACPTDLQNGILKILQNHIMVIR